MINNFLLFKISTNSGINSLVDVGPVMPRQKIKQGLKGLVLR